MISVSDYRHPKDLVRASHPVHSHYGNPHILCREKESVRAWPRWTRLLERWCSRKSATLRSNDPRSEAKRVLEGQAGGGRRAAKVSKRKPVRDRVPISACEKLTLLDISTTRDLLASPPDGGFSACMEPQGFPLRAWLASNDTDVTGRLVFSGSERRQRRAVQQCASLEHSQPGAETGPCSRPRAWRCRCPIRS